MERGLAVVTIPEYNISLTWTYVTNESQIGRVFIKKFPEPDSRLRQYVNYSDNVLNELAVSGILFGNPLTSLQGYFMVNT